MAFTKPTVKLGLSRLHRGQHRYTDRMEFLSPGVLIGFKARPAGVAYPTPAMKASVQASAIQARNIVRIANDEIAKVMFLRKDETPLFTSVITTHFNLAPGNTAGGLLKDNVVDKAFSVKAVFEKDRRWILEKIRQKFLSLSFHLNTGLYVIDMDTAARTVEGGHNIALGTQVPRCRRSRIRQRCRLSLVHGQLPRQRRQHRMGRRFNCNRRAEDAEYGEQRLEQLSRSRALT